MALDQEAMAQEQVEVLDIVIKETWTDLSHRHLPLQDVMSDEDLVEEWG